MGAIPASCRFTLTTTIAVAVLSVMEHTLRIEMDRAPGWELRAEGTIPAAVTTDRIERDLAAYAIQYPHRARRDGIEIARSA